MDGVESENHGERIFEFEELASYDSLADILIENADDAFEKIQEIRQRGVTDWNFAVVPPFFVDGDGQPSWDSTMRMVWEADGDSTERRVRWALKKDGIKNSNFAARAKQHEAKLWKEWEATLAVRNASG